MRFVVGPAGLQAAMEAVAEFVEEVALGCGVSASEGAARRSQAGSVRPGGVEGVSTATVSDSRPSQTASSRPSMAESYVP